MLRKIVILCCIAVSISIGPGRAETIPVDGYAAVVNDRIITVGEVMSMIAPVEMQLRSLYQGEELSGKLKEAYEAALQSLIDTALILEFFEEQEAQLPERVVDDQINEVIGSRFAGDRAAFLEALAEEQITLDEWREQVRDNIAVQLLRRSEVNARVAVSPLDVRKAYEDRLDDFRTPEKVKLRMIVLHKGESEDDTEVKRQEASRIRQRLLEGENFATVAREVSEDNKAKQGGDWGWMEPDDLRAELASVIKDLDAGHVSDIIEVENALYLMKVEARQNAGIIPFAEVRTEIEEDLQKIEMDRLLREWMERLRGKYHVQTFE